MTRTIYLDGGPWQFMAGGRRCTAGRIDRPLHERKRTPDHGYFPQMSGGGRPDEDRPSTSWTNSDDRPWLFVLDGRRRTVDEDRPSISWTYSVGRTIRNIKMWTEMDGWTDGRKPVRRGLIRSTCCLWSGKSWFISYEALYYIIYIFYYII